MGYLLKEALKTLCGVNQWSYAVFWTFGSQNPKLLIWEECYYEPVSYVDLPKISGTMNSEPNLDNWNACWASAENSAFELPAPAGNKIHLLVKKMMMDNHLNIVGEGLVGRAGFTGNYQWILSEKYTGEGHPPEVVKEVVQQISAGVQTVAVIPVLPHGVIQLGSRLAIMENLAFVKDVKSLVLQLGCVPGILLSDNYTTKEPTPKIGLPVYPEKSVSVDTNSSASFIDSVNYQTSSAQTASGQVHDKLKSTGSTFDVSNMAWGLDKSHDEHCQAIIRSLIKLNIPSVGQVLNEVTNAEVIHSDPDVWSNKASLYSSMSTFLQQSPISSFAANSSSLRLLEQRILSDAVHQNNNDNKLSVSDRYMSSPLRTNTCFVSGSHENAVISQSVEMNGLFRDGNSHLKTVADLDPLQDTNRSCNKNIPSITPVGNGIQHASLSGAESSLSCMMDNLTTNHLLSGHHTADHTAVTSEMKEGIENELFRAISIPLPQNDEHLKLSEHVPNFNHYDEKLRYGSQITSWENPKLENSYVQHQSGDDLFDILGIDFRNKMVNGSWNDFPHSGFDSNLPNFNKNKSTSSTSQDAASDLYSVNQGSSESGIVSATGHDHLLDAVISMVHPSSKESLDDNISCISRVRPSSKQSLDDNISCKTSLTNTSSLSCPDTSSYPCGQAGVSGQVQGEAFGLPRTLFKAGLQGNCSLLSGSSKDNAGTCSQSSSTYGSQISSWVGQTHDIKQCSSVSTAYSKKPDLMSKTNRKRLKPGENPRPRPKDRQMIQDRVKELREIVPNGAKCSIDALLERTIKHMLFLQSVTKHADKLKQAGESKMFCKEGGLLLKDNFEGGATWAYEVGSQSMVCPIIVEDLNQPRQMSVEMLCKERGLFLEIADIIRGLGLTILKGVMETHNDKIWARFAVEANRDVTRMEIFISLVRLLDQTAKSGPSPINGVGNDDMMVRQFHQATSITANSKPCSFQ